MKKKPLPPFSFKRPLPQVLIRHLNNGIVNLKYLDKENNEHELNCSLVRHDPNAFRPDKSGKPNMVQVWDIDEERWIEFDYGMLTDYKGRVE